LQRVKQREKEFARRAHLRDVERKRLAIDEPTQQTRLANALRSEDQQGFAYLSLALQASHLFVAFNATQVLRARRVLDGVAHILLKQLPLPFLSHG
jgi:hypothetical protein